jgi:hypothetical protein
MKGAVPASLTLVDEYDTLTIRPEVVTASDPIVCKSWDLGAPEVRSTMAENATADGTLDTSGYTGARTVTMDLQILGDTFYSPYAYAERLAAMTHPARRPKLFITRNSPEARGQQWELQLRGNPFSISYGRRAAAMLEMQLSFTAPLGYLLGPLQGYESTWASDTTSTGFGLPTGFPMSTGTAAADNPYIDLSIGGSAPVHPVIYIYGYSKDPEIRGDTGEVFKFAGLTVPTGQFVEIDMAAGTVRMAAAPDASVYGLVDWSVSTFWRWQPGPHTLRYIATSGRAAIHFRERRFTI